MHTIEIGHKITKYYPECIEEMTSQQYIEFVRLVILYQANQLTYTAFSLRLTYMFLDMERRININEHKNVDKILDNLQQLTALNNAFFEEQSSENGKVVKVLNTDFIKNPLPEFKHLNIKGPDDALVNTTFGEYVSALNAYIDYSNSGEESDLNVLVASLYRPICKQRQKQHLDDIREPFHKDRINYYITKIKDLDFEYKYGIYLWFASCQKFIVTNTDLTLSGGVSVDLSSLFKGTGNDKGIGMAGIIFDLAESNVFGTSDEVEQKPTYDVLVRMVQTKQQAEKLKRDVKNR